MRRGSESVTAQDSPSLWGEATMVGFIMALIKLFGGGTPAEYGVLGLGGGLWLISCAVAILIRGKLAQRAS
jgi:hypothetical protein